MHWVILVLIAEGHVWSFAIRLHLLQLVVHINQHFLTLFAFLCQSRIAIFLWKTVSILLLYITVALFGFKFGASFSLLLLHFRLSEFLFEAVNLFTSRLRILPPQFPPLVLQQLQMNRLLPNNDNVDCNVHCDKANDNISHDCANGQVRLKIVEAEKVVQDHHDHNFVEKVHLVGP